MSIWILPTSLRVGGVDWQIRSDFRAILDILKYFSDPEYEPDEQWEICLTILYVDYENMPDHLYEEAATKAIEFIDMGIKDDGRRKPHTMDWEQDAPIIIPAVNRTLGKEIRSLEYLHWWTFMGAYMEIGESLFSQIVNIRHKKQSKKPLDQWERDFYRNNKGLIDLKEKYTQEELEEQKRLNVLLE